jgi:aquaporin Z
MKVAKGPSWVDDQFLTQVLILMKSLRHKADAAQRQHMAQRQLPMDFLNDPLEWRRIFAEAWGTFLWVVVAAGGEVVALEAAGP